MVGDGDVGDGVAVEVLDDHRDRLAGDGNASGFGAVANGIVVEALTIDATTYLRKEKDYTDQNFS